MDWTFIFMARIDGTQRGFHVLASSVMVFSTLYSSARLYQAEKPQGLRRIVSLVWLPLICATFFYGLHEVVFNPLYFGSAYLGGQQAEVVKIFSDPKNVTNGLLDIQVAMFFFGLVYLRKSFRPKLVFWLPFMALISFWFIIGMPVTVPSPELAHPAITNTLANNVLEGLYTSTFGIGFCGSFK